MANPIQELVTLAKESGVAKDQLLRFLNSGYVPFPWQLKFHGAARLADRQDGPVDIGVGGARGPGKSHATFAQVTLDDCQRVPRLKGLFLRQTGKSAEESFGDLIENILVGRLAHQYNSSKNILRFPNGSRVILGGFENDKDIDKYTGIQYDVIVVEERNQLMGDKIIKLQGSLRSNKPNWRARMYSSFNPGNVGHSDVRQTFVVPYQNKQETKTRFIPSTFRDNPFLKKEYIDYLNSLPEALRKAWRDGNWDVFAGQYFTEWNTNWHVIEPFPIPSTWRRFRAYDHGRNAPACCKWYALDYDGRVYVYRELYVRGLNVDQIAQKINVMSGSEEYEYSVADPSIFAKTGFVDQSGGQTLAESFARHGVTFIPASNRRIDGWNLMHQYLHWEEAESLKPAKLPKMVYFNTCFDSIRTIPLLIHSELKPEDLNTNNEDHAADCDRYFLLSLHEQASIKPKTEVELKLDEIRRRQSGEISPSVLNSFYQGDFYRNL